MASSSLSSLRDHARAIFAAGVAAVEPRAAVLAHCRVDGEALIAGEARMPLGGRVVVVGAGKASAAMARGVEEVLGARISGGVIVTKHGHAVPLARMRLLEAGHPVPDAAGEHAAAEIERAVSGLTERDLVVVCLSGGASALMPAPRAGLTLADEQAVSSLLLASGADIAQMNTVRKKLSRLKGGGLARACAPASVLTLAISDVAGDDWGVIGSGPTTADGSTFADALAVCLRFDLLARLPPAVAGLIERGAAGLEPDALKPTDPCFARARRVMLASNRQAIEAAAAAARALGYEAVIASTRLVGEAAAASAAFTAEAGSISTGTGAGRVCLIAGGETTVTLGARPGMGGRNQEFALAAACALERSRSPLAVLAAGTDGTDGPTDAAGGVVDAGTCARARAAGLDPAAHLARHDAYPLLRSSGDLLVTGPTGTNVMDLAIALIA